MTTNELPIEATTAARWWADRLRCGAKHQSGSPLARSVSPQAAYETDIIDVLSLMVAESVRKLSAEQIDLFESCLARIVDKRFCQSSGWKPDQPKWGCAMRTLAVDYGACDELRAAYQYAGGTLNARVFPIKTVMWISPGSVTVRYGYGSDSEELLVKAVDLPDQVL
jgi:hypothetical protein